MAASDWKNRVRLNPPQVRYDRSPIKHWRETEAIRLANEQLRKFGFANMGDPRQLERFQTNLVRSAEHLNSLEQVGETQLDEYESVRDAHNASVTNVAEASDALDQKRIALRKVLIELVATHKGVFGEKATISFFRVANHAVDVNTAAEEILRGRRMSLGFSGDRESACLDSPFPTVASHVEIRDVIEQFAQTKEKLEKAQRYFPDRKSLDEVLVGLSKSQWKFETSILDLVLAVGEGATPLPKASRKEWRPGSATNRTVVRFRSIKQLIDFASASQ
jgi:hypothetical protein